MDSGTLSNESFNTYAKAKFELVKLDQGENGADFEKLGITSIPTVVVLGSDGQEIARIDGDPGASELKARLEAALND
jgi:thioredoxin-like negative regulator of GroEL